MITLVKNRGRWVFLWVGLLLVTSGIGRAEDSPSPTGPDRPVLTLEESIRRAVKNNPEIKETQIQVKISQAKLDEVKGNQFPQLELINILGPSPGAKGGDNSFNAATNPGFTASCTQLTPCRSRWSPYH